MRAFRQGSDLRVTADHRDVRSFMDRWPASGLHGLRSVSAIFERNGDLVDLYTNGRSGAGRYDGAALLALIEDMQNYGAGKLETRRQNPRGSPKGPRPSPLTQTRLRIEAAAASHFGVVPDVFYEHGQWWVKFVQGGDEHVFAVSGNHRYGYQFKSVPRYGYAQHARPQRRNNPVTRKRYRLPAKFRARNSFHVLKVGVGGRVFFDHEMSVQVHRGQNVRRYYAMKPLDMSYERRVPSPEAKQAMQYLALEAAYGHEPLDYYVDHVGDVYADPR